MKKTILILFLLPLLLSCKAEPSKPKLNTKFPDSYTEAEKLSKGEMRALPDLRVKTASKLEEAILQGKNIVELRLLRNSIFAQYGYEFTVDWIRSYFETRPWYRPGGFDAKELTKADHQSISIISKYERIASRLNPTFDRIEDLSTDAMKKLPDMRIMAGSPLDEGWLKERTKVELRLLRNSIFAQYGRTFETDWIQRYFMSRNWYKAGDFREKELTPVDLENIKLIQIYEKRLNNEGLAIVLDMGYCERENSWDSVERFVFKTEGFLDYSRESWGPYESGEEERLQGVWRVRKDKGVEYKFDEHDDWTILQIDPSEHQCT